MKFLRIYNVSPEKAIDNKINEVLDLAKKEWNQGVDGAHPKGNICIQSLRPYHVDNTGHTLPDASGYETWNIVIATAYTFQDWINCSLNKNVYIIVTGFFNRTCNPSATQFRFAADNLTLAVQNFEEVYTWEEVTAFFSDPFAVQPEKNFTARIYGRRAQTELIGLKGFGVVKTLIATTEI